MKFIVFEGVDGSGKQTQSALLVQKLKDEGRDIKYVSFPNYDSPSSAPTKMYLDGEIVEKASSLDAYSASILFTTDRVCTINRLKRDWQDDSIIIFDRYTTANMFHQASKIENRRERKRYLKWLEKLEYQTLKLPKPDQVFFLNITPEQSENLRKNRGENKTHTQKDIHENDITYLEKSYNCGMAVAKNKGWEIINCVKDDSLRTIEDIHEEIYKKLKI